ncbi:MAG: hypothetical protein IPH05_02555 [Flavobacteriales bacterium]|jgi:hypothetical protein|nr:hypothetical protein [Flavobacteriales bacterium]MBK6550008.1 hypothetical protein [Flavobacteriales bacterium]MBK6881829.1 hypothetical protein [Flavobacteriales bacterium]MBK7102518.1 hypothetical protein [Flavobacteriales bacterium]MBK7113252.1 hypothetical protein [Flavobacteriales bacterium]
MMRRLRILTLSLLALPGIVSAQSRIQGEVTFLTSQHVYVKFESTEGIAENDTLKLMKDGVLSPCLVVGSMSSTSCVCKVIAGCTVEKADRIQANVRSVLVQNSPIGVRNTAARKAESDPLPESTERIRGRLSAASYSMMPSERESDHRLMYRFSLDADNINNSKFSAETYLNYRILYPADPDRRPQRTEFFNVYNLAVSYAADSNTTLIFGRKINNSASSLGAIDGAQAERRFGNVFAGVIAGFRPDIYNYGLNLDLLQYGGYIGTQFKTSNVYSRSTVGLLQQTNSGKVDRRYTYLQHSTTYKGNLNIFSSAELDLYGTLGSGPRLTNFFLSARYRFGRKVDVFASYDSRRRVVFYETYRNDVEELLDDDDARQGARFRVNVRPMKALSLGGAYTKRFQAGGLNASDNISATVNINKDPESVGRWSVQANRNTSSYVRSDVLSFRHGRTIIPRSLTMGLYYRIVEYTYANRTDGSSLSARAHQRYYGADLMLTFARTLTFTVLGELATVADEQNYRLNMSLTKRFDSKRKR